MPDPTVVFPSTDRSIRSDGDHRAILLRRAYDVPAVELWSAWTEPSRVARWLGEITGERTIGGEVRLAMTPQETVVLRIEACVAPQRLTATWSSPGEPESRIDLTIEERGESTLLTLEHSLIADERIAVGKGYGWEDFLNRLHELLAGREPSAVSWDDAERHLAPLWRSLT